VLSEDRGVLWARPGGGQLLFSFGEFDFPLPDGATATRVTGDGESEAPLTAGRLRTEPCAVYRIE